MVGLLDTQVRSEGCHLYYAVTTWVSWVVVLVVGLFAEACFTSLLVFGGL